MSFIKMKNKGRNGKQTGVDGKRRNRITKEEFARIAFQCDGDVNKMAEENNLNQPVAAIKNRYENLVSKEYTYEEKSLPEMVYKSSGRTRVPIDQKKLIELAKQWNKTGGDAEVVAETIGCSVATVLMKIRQLDETYENIYKKELISKGKTEEEANDSIEKEGFVSPLCPRKVKQRGRSAAKLDDATISSITELLAGIEVPIDNEEEEANQELSDLINAAIEDIE